MNLTLNPLKGIHFNLWIMLSVGNSTLVCTVTHYSALTRQGRCYYMIVIWGPNSALLIVLKTKHRMFWFKQIHCWLRGFCKRTHFGQRHHYSHHKNGQRLLLVWKSVCVLQFGIKLLQIHIQLFISARVLIYLSYDCNGGMIQLSLMTCIIICIVIPPASLSKSVTT